jgi:hypothetical protein
MCALGRWYQRTPFKIKMVNKNYDRHAMKLRDTGPNVKRPKVAGGWRQCPAEWPISISSTPPKKRRRRRPAIAAGKTLLVDTQERRFVALTLCFSVWFAAPRVS